ncbi:hypothetical protein [Sporomusa sphaeroides]|uniref:Chaperone protein DnaK n=1 Tax=Sporomusa sphaeroides DSM 2875 TaxID=1337886 RepID=A0ABP2C6Q6_9FIRM|nr:hypothetical protein [Sporomusa sphaeroides]OLS56603.1 hypothetical protein SPSPH_00930 [Sporomusa sphaeroides DSM 2875]CVK19029.1 hypothetical protein SSPH_01673 [Sporomusa sphaeroides DSM 2875]
MAGGLTIDFGNCYTVAAYWRQDVRQAEVLYIPGVTRPIPGNAVGQAKRVYAAPSLISYGAAEAGEVLLVGQEAAEGLSGVAVERKLFSNLQADVITGKTVYSLAGRRRLSGQEIAGDYLASFISRAGQALGLAGEAAIMFTMPAAACQSEKIWQRYRRWLENAVRQAGFSRLELVEQPWAAARGAGMPLKPEAVYVVITVNADMVEAVIVRVTIPAGKENMADARCLMSGPGGCYPYSGGSGSFSQDDTSKRHLRVLSRCAEWLTGEEPGGEPMQLTAIVQQVLREAERLGYPVGSLAGAVVTGSSVTPAIVAALHSLFTGIPVYDKQPLAAAACGGAALAAGEDACGYIRHSYGLRFLAAAGYQYRELVGAGMFYPSTGAVGEFTVKASYDGQQEFALFIYRLEDGGQCINEDNPLILTTRLPAAKGQAVLTVSVSLDSAGQLLVTATAAGSGELLADRAVVAKLV